MKLLRGKEPEMRSEGKLVALPVKLCEPHPDLQTRLKYDQVDALAGSVRVHGQLQPGRAVERPDGSGYWIYMGIGRLLAIKKLFEKDGEPKSYYALLDEGLPFVELFSRSMSENLKRRNLSVLEEVRSFYLASRKADEDDIVAASAKIGEEPSAVRKRIELARALGERLGKLYDIETRAGSSFQLGHLEALSKLGEEKAFYEAAAAVAFARFNVKELQAALRSNSIDKIAAGLPPWFYELFPEYAAKPEENGEAPGPGATNEAELPKDANVVSHFVMVPQRVTPPHSGEKPAEISTAAAKASASQPPAGVTFKERLSFVECPHCGAQNPFELKEDSELTLIRFQGSAVPKKDAAAPEGSFRRSCTCVSDECGREFWLWGALVDGEVRAETRRKDEEGWFPLPRKSPRVGSVSWSAEKRAWMVKDARDGRLYVYADDRKFAGA
ncbi:MAG: hypothetical protein JRN11_08475 [Nitrososphaerota archaeon]|nr:hypothetical protein [Nitrososphaerota archaeon]